MDEFNRKYGLDRSEIDVDESLNLINENRNVQYVYDEVEPLNYAVCEEAVPVTTKKVSSDKFKKLGKKVAAVVVAGAIVFGGATAYKALDNDIPQIDSYAVSEQLGQDRVDIINEYCQNVHDDGVPSDEIAVYIDWAQRGMHITYDKAGFEQHVNNDSLYYDSIEYYNFLHECKEKDSIDKETFNRGIKLSQTIQSIDEDLDQEELDEITEVSYDLVKTLTENGEGNVEVCKPTENLLAGLIDKADSKGMDSNKLHAIYGSISELSDYYSIDKEGKSL